MSAVLQQVPGKRHEVSDDLESAFHLLRWCAIKYFPHDVSMRPAAVLAMLRHFDYREEDHNIGIYRGSQEKYWDVVYNRHISGLAPQHPFTRMLAMLGKLFANHYQALGLRPPVLREATTRPSIEETSGLDPALEAWLEYTSQHKVADDDPVYKSIKQHVAALTAPAESSDTVRGPGIPLTVPATAPTSGVYTHNLFVTIIADSLKNGGWDLEIPGFDMKKGPWQNMGRLGHC